MAFDLVHRSSLLLRGIVFMNARAEYLQNVDCLESMVMACIAGIVTRDGIVRTVPKYIGHSYPHVAVILDQNTGNDPAKHLWRLDNNEAYHLNPVMASPPPRRRTTRRPPLVLHDEMF